MSTPAAEGSRGKPAEPAFDEAELAEYRHWIVWETYVDPDRRFSIAGQDAPRGAWREAFDRLGHAGQLRMCADGMHAERRPHPTRETDAHRLAYSLILATLETSTTPRDRGGWDVLAARYGIVSGAFWDAAADLADARLITISPDGRLRPQRTPPTRPRPLDLAKLGLKLADTVPIEKTKTTTADRPATSSPPTTSAASTASANQPNRSTPATANVADLVANEIAFEDPPATAPATADQPSRPTSSTSATSITATPATTTTTAAGQVSQSGGTTKTATTDAASQVDQSVSATSARPADHVDQPTRPTMATSSATSPATDVATTAEAADQVSQSGQVHPPAETATEPATPPAGRADAPSTTAIAADDSPATRPVGYWGTEADLRHRTRRRILVALTVEGGTAKSSRITSGYLARPQRRVRDAALRELVASGAVRETYPGSPRLRGYRLVDPTLGGFTATEIDTEATRIKAQRRDR